MRYLYDLEGTPLESYTEHKDYAPTLEDILTASRAHSSVGEAALFSQLQIWFPDAMVDAHGNLWLIVGDNPTTLFTAHTDTVHAMADTPSYKVEYLTLHNGDLAMRRAGGGILGADDGTGVYILHQLIERDVAGVYAFFRGEERGGIGSSAAASDLNSEASLVSTVLTGVTKAIAFDRKGYYDVIRYQSGGECCSDDFALALCDALSTEDNIFLPEDGVYTDTAEFIHNIPECTNISVGYFNQHTSDEWQNVSFVHRLVDQLASVDFDVLPISRDPLAARSRYSWRSTTTPRETYYVPPTGSWDYNDSLVGMDYYEDEEDKKYDILMELTSAIEEDFGTAVDDQLIDDVLILLSVDEITALQAEYERCSKTGDVIGMTAVINELEVYRSN